MEDDHAYAVSPSKKQKTVDMVDGKPAYIVKKECISPTSLPDPSSAVVELRQRLREAEVKIERANRTARVAQERADLAEKYYDSRKESAEMQFIVWNRERDIEWHKQLLEARRQSDQANAKNDDLTRQNKDLRSRLRAAEKVALDTGKLNVQLTLEMEALKKQTAETVRKAKDKIQRNVELVKANGLLRAKISREAVLFKEFEKQAAEAQKNYQAKIADLTSQNTRLEIRLEQQVLNLVSWQLQQQQPERRRTKPVPARKQLQQQPTAAAAKSPPQQPLKLAASDKSKNIVVKKNETGRINSGELPNITLHDFCDPINIFQLVRINTPDSMSIDSAFTAIMLAFTKVAQDKWWRYRNINSVELYCEACGVGVVKVQIFEHFLMEDHIQLVRDAGGVISRPALQHWLRQLQLATSVAAVVAVPTATPPAALAAAAAAVDELHRSAAAAAAEPLPLFEKEVKNEVKEEVKEEDMEMEN